MQLLRPCPPGLARGCDQGGRGPGEAQGPAWAQPGGIGVAAGLPRAGSRLSPHHPCHGPGNSPAALPGPWAARSLAPLPDTPSPSAAERQDLSCPRDTRPCSCEGFLAKHCQAACQHVITAALLEQEFIRGRAWLAHCCSQRGMDAQFCLCGNTLSRAFFSREPNRVSGMAGVFVQEPLSGLRTLRMRPLFLLGRACIRFH